MALGETLHPEQGTLVAEDGQDRHQQHPPLRKANPRRMRQSSNALGKLIRWVAAAGFWSGGVNGERQGLTSKPLLPRARQGYWDRLLIDPGPAGSGLPVGSNSLNQGRSSATQHPGPGSWKRASKPKQ